MKSEKLRADSYIQRTYSEELNSLPLQYKIYHSIDKHKDELLIHKKAFKTLPRLKGIACRGKECNVIFSDSVIQRIKITVPYTITKETVMKDCTKFHNDYIEYEVEHKVYEPTIKDFINENLERFKTDLNPV